LDHSKELIVPQIQCSIPFRQIRTIKSIIRSRCRRVPLQGVTLTEIHELEVLTMPSKGRPAIQIGLQLASFVILLLT